VKIQGFLVALDQDYDDEQATKIAAAIATIRGVSSVTSKDVNINDFVERARLRASIGQKVLDVLLEPTAGSNIQLLQKTS
jgi:hypothetical protein